MRRERGVGQNSEIKEDGMKFSQVDKKLSCSFICITVVNKWKVPLNLFDF